jgi:hypothetical protein
MTMRVRQAMKPPPGVIVMELLLGLIVILNGLRILNSIIFGKILPQYGVNASYIRYSGSFWVIICLLILLGIWYKKGWSWCASFGGIVGYMVWYWFDRLVIQKPHSNWPFALVVTCFSLFLMFLFQFLPGTRSYYSKSRVL